METLFMVILVGLSGPLVTAMFLGDNKCNLTPWSDLSKADSHIIEMEIPKDCNEGSVDWNYPTGSIHLKVTRNDGNFALCIEESWFTVLGEVRELTGGLDKPLPLPSDGKPSCTQNLYGTAELLVKAQEPLLYMTTFNYKLKFPGQ